MGSLASTLRRKWRSEKRGDLVSVEIDKATESAMETREEARTTTRPRFLRQLLVTLAAGVGAATFAARALGVTGNCCENCFLCPGCSAGTCVCYCDCSQVGGENYCFTDGPCMSGCQPCPC